MVKQKKVIFAVVAVVLCCIAAFYLFRAQPSAEKGSPEATATEQSAFGVIDMRRAMQAHPQYQKLTQLKKERNTLALSAEQGTDVNLSMPEPALDMTTMADSMRQKRNQKAQQKLKELNENLEKRHNALATQHGAAFEAETTAIDASYVPQIFNLQLKLDTLQVSKETAVEIQRQIVALKSEHMQKLHASQQAFLQKLSVLMQPEKEKAGTEMDAYMADLDRALMEEQKQVAEQAQARNHLAMAQKTNELKVGMKSSADLRGTLNDKDEEIAVLEEKILQDISGKTAKIALQQKLSAVLASVQVNVSAVDVTDLVIQEFKN